jgi:hypothetical protein
VDLHKIRKICVVDQRGISSSCHHATVHMSLSALHEDRLESFSSGGGR